MITIPWSNFLTRYTETLAKFSQQLAGITLLCYLTGFVITNLYLGSLGIVNLDILRARYILSGLLFLLFLSAIGYLIYGLIQTLRRHQQLSPLRLVWEVARSSFRNIFFLYLSIPAIGILAGLRSSQPVGIPQLSPNVSWADWFAKASINNLRKAAMMCAGLLIIAALIIIIIGAVKLISPKDTYGVRKPRKLIVGEAFKGVKQKATKFLGTLLAVFVVAFTIIFIFDSLGFITSNKISAPGTSSTAFFTEGLWRYLFAIVLVYTLVAVFVTTFSITQSSSSSRKEGPGSQQEDNPLGRAQAWIYLTALAIIIIVPAYALGIYPYLPQNIGGGSIMRVEALVSSDELKPYFTDPNIETFLIDRTSNSSLFLLLDKSKEKHRIIEIASGLVKSITYNPTP